MKKILISVVAVIAVLGAVGACKPSAAKPIPEPAFTSCPKPEKKKTMIQCIDNKERDKNNVICYVPTKACKEGKD